MDRLEQNTTPAKSALNSESPSELLNRWIRDYGPTVYDLCESILWSPATATTLYKQVLQAWENLAKQKEHFHRHERAFVYSHALSLLIPFAEKHGRKPGASEQLMLDSNYTPIQKVDFLESYLHRLSPRDQALLLFTYKHSLEDAELSSILSEPIESLRLHRYQALESLRAWIWESTA